MLEMGLGLKSSNSRASILSFSTSQMLAIKRFKDPPAAIISLCDSYQLNQDKPKDQSVTSTLTFQ